MLLSSSTFDLTAFEALFKAFNSLSSRSISTTSVTPFAPNIVGTPKYTSFIPNSPLTQEHAGIISLESEIIDLTIVAAAEEGAKYALQVLSKPTISAPPSEVFWTNSEISSLLSSSLSGLPATLHCEGTGTIVSP